jgi:DNA-binding response OmpR family regulator
MPSGRGTQSAPLRERRILAVDDDVDVCRMIATVLESAGASVDGAVSGVQAEKLLVANDYDAVLLDWNLQDMPAGDFLVRAERARAGIIARTLVITGDLLRRADVHEAERRGMPLLRKPFRPKDLIAAVTTLAVSSRQ